MLPKLKRGRSELLKSERGREVLPKKFEESRLGEALMDVRRLKGSFKEVLSKSLCMMRNASKGWPLVVSHLASAASLWDEPCVSGFYKR